MKINCLKCNKEFESRNKNYKYCQSPCTGKKTYSEIWLDRKDEKDRKKGLDSNEIFYRQTWKKSPGKNSVKIWRG